MYTSSIKGKITQYFKEKWSLRDYRNGWLKGECPYCGAEKFGINVSKAKANCFKCGNKFNPLKCIMELENLDTKPQVYELLKTFEGVAFLEPKVEAREWHKISLPESFKLLAFGNSILADHARNYMKKRGFNINSLSAKGIGYCVKGPYAGFIIFPFYQKGKLIYFIGRQFIQLSEKFKNPSVEDFGIGKSQLTYNADSLAIYNKIYVVESITNCLTSGDNSVATLGKTISNYQLSMLHGSPCKKLVIGLDPDAILEAIKLALKVINHKKVKIIQFPEGKDINNLGKEWLKETEKKTPWLKYTDLLKLKHKYEARTLNSFI